MVTVCDPYFPSKIGKKEEEEEKEKERERAEEFCLEEKKKTYVSVHNSIIFF